MAVAPHQSPSLCVFGREAQTRSEGARHEAFFCTGDGRSPGGTAAAPRQHPTRRPGTVGWAPQHGPCTQKRPKVPKAGPGATTAAGDLHHELSRINQITEQSTFFLFFLFLFYCKTQHSCRKVHKSETYDIMSNCGSVRASLGPEIPPPRPPRPPPPAPPPPLRADPLPTRMAITLRSPAPVPTT